MNKIFIVFTALLFASHVSFSQIHSSFTESALKKHIQYLASDKLKGRKSGSPEALKAAGYIRKQFKNQHLELPFDNGFQYFDVVTAYHMGKNNTFKTAELTAKAGTDFIPLVFSADTSVSADVFFAGYGFDIQTDKFKWNDYADVDVKGKIVVLFNGEPDLKERNNPFSEFSSDNYKAMVAADKGAAGVIFIYPASEKKEDFLPPLVFSKTNSRSKIPVIQISRSFASMALFTQNQSLEMIESSILEKKSPMSFDLEKNVSLSTEVITSQGKACNVAAILKGSDPLLKDEYIVIGAHYDHLGMGGPGSGSRFPDTIAVHNGADDNASGVAAMIELAGKLCKNRSMLKRSVIFVAFTGEESGLLGSSKFVASCPVPLSRIKAMINMDMVGRLDTISKYLLIGGTGTARENDSLFSIFEKEYSFDFKKSPEGLGPSDHASFYANNIPVIFITTGAHNDYHTWADDEEKINYKGMTNLLEFVEELATSYANLPQITFQEAGPKTKSSSGSYKVTLGILPDFSASDVKGLKIQSVRSGGPAQLSGMRNGDVITAVNGAEVNNIYDYMNRLKSLHPGDQITVDVVRDGTRITLFVQL